MKNLAWDFGVSAMEPNQDPQWESACTLLPHPHTRCTLGRGFDDEKHCWLMGLTTVIFYFRCTKVFSVGGWVVDTKIAYCYN